jgi:hypothetical protein
MSSLMIHQPEFMPWTNLFTKMSFCDHYVFLDNVQYVRRSYQNRNKFKYSDGSKWITVPVQKTSRDELICNIEIDNSTDWRGGHKSFFEMAYGKANYYDSIIKVIDNIYDKDWTSLSDLNCFFTQQIAGYLKLNNSFSNASKIGEAIEKSENILNICKEMNADNYICGYGSKQYLDEKSFKQNGINITYLEPMLIKHNQQFPQLGFIEGLSIFDYLFNNGIDEFLLKLDTYKKTIILDHDYS